nr:hypothetical protein [Rhodopirellula sallentina]
MPAAQNAVGGRVDQNLTGCRTQFNTSLVPKNWLNRLDKERITIGIGSTVEKIDDFVPIVFGNSKFDRTVDYWRTIRLRGGDGDGAQLV